MYSSGYVKFRFYGTLNKLRCITRELYIASLHDAVSEAAGTYYFENDRQINGSTIITYNGKRI